MRTNMDISNYSLREVLEVAKKVTPQLSFFGSQYLSIDQSNQILPLDALAAQVMDIVEQNPQFSEEERIVGKEVASLIDRIYELNIKNVEQSNCITQILWCLRENLYSLLCLRPRFYLHCSRMRWAWGECERIILVTGYRQIFRYYTREQYINVFGHPPEKDRGENDNARFADVECWLAPGEVIQFLYDKEVNLEEKHFKLWD